MQIKHLEYFVATVECGSISQAARRLFLLPQTLSAAIAGLEQELGFKLFVRQRQGVSLTLEGHRVFEGAKAVLSITDSWLALGRQNKEALSGEVNVNVGLALCSSFNRFLIGLEKDYPKLSVSLNEARGKTNVARMKDGGVYLSCCSFTDDVYEDYLPLIQEQQWEVTPLLEDEFTAVLGRGYFPQIQDYLTLEDCAKMTLICSSDPNDVVGRDYFTMFGHKLISRVESHASLLYMVAKNHGALILPKRIARCEPMYQAGMLRFLPIDGVHLKTTHYMLYAPKQDRSPVTRDFMKLIQDYYARAGWEKHDGQPG